MEVFFYWSDFTIPHPKFIVVKGEFVMKLTEQDKTLLLDWGYEERDFPQIKAAMFAPNTHYTLNDSPIDRSEAISLLGWQEYLSGIARSAFHWTAVRETEDGRRVYFDSSNLFKH